MSEQKIPTAEAVLCTSFTGRILDHLTGLNLDKLAKNLDSALIVRCIGEVATERLTSQGLDRISDNFMHLRIFKKPEAAPWTALTAITDTISSAESERTDSKEIALTNTVIRFDSNLGRDRFQFIIEGALAGIQPNNMPRIRSSGQRELMVHDMAYADLATLGRVSTALLRTEFTPILGRNIRGVAQQTIEEMTTAGFRNYLPSDLAIRADQQEAFLGADSLLSSGKITLVGRAMRQVLVPSQSELETAQNENKEEEQRDWLLAIQRKFGDRPYIEARTRFISDRKEVPTSHTPMKVVLKEQVEQRLHEFRKPYKEHDWDKVARDIWSLASGLGASEGVGALVRAIATITRASATARTSMYFDRRELKKRQSQKHIENPTD